MSLSRQTISRLTESPAEFRTTSGHTKKCPYSLSKMMVVNGKLTMYSQWHGFPSMRVNPRDISDKLKLKLGSALVPPYTRVTELFKDDPEMLDEIESIVDKYNAKFGHCSIGKVTNRSKIVTIKGLTFSSVENFIKAIDGLKFYSDTPRMVQIAGNELKPGETVSQWKGQLSTTAEIGLYNFLVAGTPEQIYKAQRKMTQLDSLED